MPTLSRTSEKCRKCSKVNSCNNKRMEACAVAELPKQTISNLTAPRTGIAVMPMSNPITPITIKMGEYGDIHTSLEEINEKIARALLIDACYF